MVGGGVVPGARGREATPNEHVGHGCMNNDNNNKQEHQQAERQQHRR